MSMPRYAVLLALPLLLIGLGGAGPLLSSAPNVLVVAGGNTEALTCSYHAKLVSDGKMSPAFAVETCTEALNIEQLSQHDLAATHVNRGVLYLTMNGYEAARTDFDDAARLEPELSETYINRGAASLAMGQTAPAIADLERGIAMGGLKEPWKAYYNLGIAHEKADDLKAAYADYIQASELKPDWAEAKAELARFTVKR
jgi:tetratricopeptide (TPR) repeat protein